MNQFSKSSEPESDTAAGAGAPSPGPHPLAASQAAPSGSAEGYLCRCSVCQREERTCDNPLKNGWPECHGYTMTLIETERFVAAIDGQMAEIFSPVQVARKAAGL